MYWALQGTSPPEDTNLAIPYNHTVNPEGNERRDKKWYQLRIVHTESMINPKCIPKVKKKQYV